MDIVSTEDWGAQAPTRTSYIATPSRELWLHHTVGLYPGVAGMRRLQRDHKARGFRTVGYNFVIDADDDSLTVYEGAGAGVLGAHTYRHNSKSHGISVTGNFESRKVTEALVLQIARLVAHGYEQGWWPNQITGGHRDTKATACPGANLYKAIPEINAKVLEILNGKDIPMPDKDFDAEIERLYNDILGRPSDAEGKAYWIDQAESGTDLDVIQYHFLVVRLAADRKAMEALAEQINKPATDASNAKDIADQAMQIFLDTLTSLGTAS
jgi:hypothetical protein